MEKRVQQLKDGSMEVPALKLRKRGIKNRENNKTTSKTQ